MKPSADQPKVPEPKPSQSAKAKPDAPDAKPKARDAKLERSPMPSPMPRTI